MPRTELYYIEVMYKRQSEVWQYANYLESVLDECSQYHHPNVDFRAARPPDPDVLLGQEDDSNVTMGGDDSIPSRSLQVSALLNYPSVLNNSHPYKDRAFYPAFSISSSCRKPR